MKKVILAILSATLIISLCFLMGCGGCGKKSKFKKTNMPISYTDTVVSLEENEQSLSGDSHSSEEPTQSGEEFSEENLSSENLRKYA